MVELQQSEVWRLIVLVHAAATLFMTGVVWFVQLVHYPLFGHVGAGALPAYAAAHARLTTFIVAPGMLTEAVTAAALLAFRPAAMSFSAVAVGAGLLVIIWLSTAFLQVPLHGRLQRTGEQSLVVPLVATNWVRTLAWSGRSIIALGLI